MENFMFSVMLIAVFTAIGFAVGIGLKAFKTVNPLEYNEFMESVGKAEKLIETYVNAAEQLGNSLGLTPEKRKEYVLKLVNEYFPKYGLNFTPEEVDAMIESAVLAVNAMHAAFHMAESVNIEPVSGVGN